MKKTIRICNLDCAACAMELQEELEKIEGVESAFVDFLTQQVKLSYDNEQTLGKAVYAITHFEEVELAGEEKKESKLKEIFSIIVSAVLFIPALVLDLIGGFSDYLLFALFLASALAAGWSVVLTTIKNFVSMFKNKNFWLLLDENFLMLVAAVGAFAIGEWMEGAVVLLLYQIGEYLQDLAVGSSRKEITKLMELKSDSAVLLDGNGQREVSPEELKEGDVILLRKGDKVPADCILLDEAAQLDTKSITGEAYLKEITTGGEMLSGCVNAGNAARARVLRPSSESAVAKILNMVENSTEKKAKPEKFITKFARIYTPVVVLLAVLCAVIPPLFQGATAEAFSIWLYRALNMLVISCPCSLVISVPLTYFSGVGTLARYGVLVKGATYLDLLAKTDVAAFDKTGTLTEGKFTVGKHEKEALLLAAAVEKNSAHPLAQAFANVTTPYRCERAQEIAGMGVSGEVDGDKVLVGSARLLRENAVEFSERQSSASVVYVAKNGEYVGYAEIEDRVRQEAGEVLSALKKQKIKKIAVLTGDTKARAGEVLCGMPIDEICSDLLPEDKCEKAKALKGEGTLLYVGDGINDTPVMAQSDIAVSMGALGSDAAIEASDVVLSADNLNALPKAVKGARKTRRIVVENIVFSLVVKAALMALSIVGIVPLWLAIFGDVGVMLLCVLNSLRMKARL